MKLFEHQKEGIHIGRQGSHAFFWECGTGKSCLGLHLIQHWKAKGVAPALVVCPLSIIDAAWLDDCKKFTPELDIVSLWSKKPAERRKRINEEHDVYVCNYETFKYLYKDIAKKDFGVLIIDESSKMKNPKSKITKALLSFAGIAPKKSKKYYSRQKPIPYRYVLTGTPAPNDESEYWAQIKMITGRGNDIFHDNFYVFRSQYFYSIPLGATGQRMWKFRKQSRPEFMEQLKQVTHVVSKKDAVDLPSQIHEVRHVKLTDKEQKAYNEMVNEKVLEFENEDVLSRSALVEVMKLRQLTSGFCYGDEGIHQVGKSKLNELRDLLDEIGNHQVIIWCNFRYEIIELLKMLPNSAALWAGTKDREKVITDFKNGKKQYLIANMQSASHGLTFTNCNYGVYFSLSYSYEFQKQSQDRIHRIGQTDKVTYYYLVAKDTIDEVIYEAVNGKAQLSTEVLNYLRKGSNARNRQAVTV